MNHAWDSQINFDVWLKKNIARVQCRTNNLFMIYSILNDDNMYYLYSFLSCGTVKMLCHVNNPYVYNINNSSS